LILWRIFKEGNFETLLEPQEAVEFQLDSSKHQALKTLPYQNLVEVEVKIQF